MRTHAFPAEIKRNSLEIVYEILITKSYKTTRKIKKNMEKLEKNSVKFFQTANWNYNFFISMKKFYFPFF